MELTLTTARTLPADEAAKDSVLVRQAQANPRAFAALYGRYVARVYRYMVARVRDQQEAADLTQQVFLNALAALPKYRERGLPFAAWLFRIARNALADAHRRRKPAFPVETLPDRLQQSEELGPEALLLQKESVAQLRARLDRLNPEQQELLALRFAGELSAREIAEVVGKSEGAVKKQLSRTLNTLREVYDVK